MKRGTGGNEPRSDPSDPEAVEAARFLRGLTIGLIVGAVIAGSTLWRRFGPARPRD